MRIYDMSTVRFVASAFRWIIELLNILFALTFIFAVLVYLFNRDAIVRPAASFGYYSDFGMVVAFLLVAVTYIVFMGLLCVILEIRESLKRLETRGDYATEYSSTSRTIGNGKEPRI